MKYDGGKATERLSTKVESKYKKTLGVWKLKLRM